MIYELNIPSSKGFANVMQGLASLKPGEYLVEIKKNRKMASKEQRGYYHGVICLAIAVELGWEVDDVHEHIKATYNAKEVTDRKTGKQIIIPGSTSGFDTKQYTELVDKVKAYFLPEIGIEVPEPKYIKQSYIAELKRRYENRFHT